MSSNYSPDKIFKLDAVKKTRFVALAIFFIAIIAAFFIYPLAWDNVISKVNIISPVALPNFVKVPFKLGLDLAGGTRLIYLADVSSIAGQDSASAMSGLRDVIERRVNFFGVSEPVVQTSTVNGEYRILVEMPGVSDVDQAVKLIGTTAQLTFWEDIGTQSAKLSSPSAQLPIGITSLFENPKKRIF